MPSFTLSHQQTKQRRKTIIAAGFLLTATVVIIFAVTQLPVIREFFSRASGEPANIVVDTTAVIGPFKRPWRNLAQGGEDHAWRLQPLIGPISALNPEYIRIDHLYDFYDIVQGTSGNLQFNFSKLDPLLDDILATGAKPYIALSYTPPNISKGDIVDLPTNWNDWQLVVQKTVEHISGTRGISNVYYEVWNEPDLFGGFKYYGDKNYLTLYTHSAIGAQRARGVKPFKIGGPATTALYKNWIDALAKHALNNNLRLDFISWHRYSHDVDQYRQDMTQIQTWLQSYPRLEATVELHITEWGHDSENHPGYDNNYGAAHTVAGAIEMVGIVERAFVFEIQDGKDAQGQSHWGRWGLFTHQDVGAQAKPRYNALRLLEKIGEQRLQLLGKGTWVKGLAARDSEGNSEVVLANFDPKGRNSETVPVTFQNIEPGSYVITKELLGRAKQTEQVATTSSAIRTNLVMPVNSVGMVELRRQ